MDSSNKMIKARTQLILTQPFYSVLCLRTPTNPDPTCKTAWCDGYRIGYNPEFIATLSINKVIGLLVHEIFHKMFLHHLRRGGRDPRKWNVAADYAINSLIVAANFELPEGGLLDARYAGMGAEEIYTKLPDADYGDEEWGEIRDGQLDPRASEAQIKRDIASAMHAAKQAGKLPAGLERMCEEMLEPQIPWLHTLRRFCTEKSRGDFSWSRPNRRLISQSLYFPSEESRDRAGTFVLVGDTSGSISHEVLSVFGSEVNSIRQETQPHTTYMVWADAEVSNVQTFNRYEDVTFEPRGGGGTDFRPAFDWIEEQGIKPQCLVYFTDGYGTFPDSAPPYPVLWCMTNNDVQPPFGERLEITA